MLSRFKSVLVLSPRQPRHLWEFPRGTGRRASGENCGFEFLDVAHLLGSGTSRSTAMSQRRS